MKFNHVTIKTEKRSNDVGILLKIVMAEMTSRFRLNDFMVITITV